VRYWANGWIDSQLVDPAVRFPWPGLEWITPLPGVGTHALFVVMTTAAISLALDRRPRLAAAAFAAAFTWVELIDRANYLNHYYLVSLVAALLAVLPAGRRVPIGAYGLLRLQLGLVWVFAGLAKLDGDWLLRAQPLATWLQTAGDWPLVGALLVHPLAAYVFAWAGAAFDLTLPLWLSLRRTRRAAFAAAVVFHLTVWALFPIGIFSPLMLAGCTVFFAPGWRRRSRSTSGHEVATGSRPIGRPALLAAGLWLAIQVLVPLRFALYPGPVNWTEQGFRFAWRVMLVSKTGRAEFRITGHEPPGDYVVRRPDDLTPLQARMMATQPDLVHAYALHLAERYRARGHGAVEVRADVIVRFNGRRAAPMIDPDFDLAAIPESWRAQPFILPMP